jgi:hypothetical protein
MQIYRHMEADGVPLGYDRWQKVGIVRNPLDRLWSLYKFLQDFDGPHEPTYMQKMRDSVKCSFSHYILHNDVVFTSPYPRDRTSSFYPHYSVRHALPENRKSQFLYLRPDLGTQIYRYDRLPDFLDRLGINLQLETNRTETSPAPEISDDAQEYMRSVFAWDFKKTEWPA